MKFRTWLDGKFRTKTLKGRILDHIRPLPNPEAVLRAVAEGKLAGVKDDERKAARRLIWEFLRAGGEPEGDLPPPDLRRGPGGGRKAGDRRRAADPPHVVSLEDEIDEFHRIVDFYRALGLPL